MPGRGLGVLTAALGLALVVGTVVSGVPGVAGAVQVEGEAPLADAGLDQTVTVNATVQLDATGSRDPDGEVAAFEWQLEQPDGNYSAPDCRTCGRTSFVARQTGTYNATVTVTDDEGAISSDTLRVHVEESSGPSVTLSGPVELSVGEVAAYSASVSAGDADVAAVTWRIDGNWENRTSVSGESATVEHLHAFSSAGDSTVSVAVVDRLGRERTATRDVTVHEPSTAADGGASDVSDNDGSDSDGEECSRYNRDDDRYCNNDRMTLDSNEIVISDADNDGTTEWGGQTLDEEFAQNHDGVSYDSTDGEVEFDSQEAYKESLGVDTVNVDPSYGANNGTRERNESDGGNEENTDDGLVWSVISDNYGDDFGGSDLGNNDGGGNEDSSGGDDGDDTEDGEAEDGSETNRRTGRVPPDRAGPGGF